MDSGDAGPELGVDDVSGVAEQDHDRGPTHCLEDGRCREQVQLVQAARIGRDRTEHLGRDGRVGVELLREEVTVDELRRMVSVQVVVALVQAMGSGERPCQ